MSKTGGCLCGAVRFEIQEEVHETGACHCNMCRKWSGGVFFGVEVPEGGMVVEGDVQTYKSSEWAERSFCGKCGSSLWYRLTMPGPQSGVSHVAFGALDDQDGVAMQGEIYVDKKPSTYSFAGDHPRMTEAEFMAMIGADGTP